MEFLAFIFLILQWIFSCCIQCSLLQTLVVHVCLVYDTAFVVSTVFTFPYCRGVDETLICCFCSVHISILQWNIQSNNRTHCTEPADQVLTVIWRNRHRSLFVKHIYMYSSIKIINYQVSKVSTKYQAILFFYGTITILVHGSHLKQKKFTNTIHLVSLVLYSGDNLSIPY